jgi:hypothetical protein
LKYAPPQFEWRDHTERFLLSQWPITNYPIICERTADALDSPKTNSHSYWAVPAATTSPDMNAE